MTGLPESDDQNTRQTVLNMANGHLESSDIEKVQRMGRVTKKPRDVILTFSTQETRDSFYKNRRKLALCRVKQIYINEDLTAFRAQLYYDIRQLVKRKMIHSVWTHQGNIMLKTEESSRPIAVYGYDKLRELTAITTENSVEHWSTPGSVASGYSLATDITNPFASQEIYQ